MCRRDDVAQALALKLDRRCKRARAAVSQTELTITAGQPECKHDDDQYGRSEGGNPLRVAQQNIAPGEHGQAVEGGHAQCAHGAFNLRVIGRDGETVDACRT